MSYSIDTYYQQELNYLRQDARVFAQRYPNKAAALGLDGHEIQDPSVQHLLQSFALLTAKLHQQCDNDRDRYAYILLQQYYPELTATKVPSGLLAFSSPSQATRIDASEAVTAIDANNRSIALYVKQAITLQPWSIDSVTLVARALMPDPGCCEKAYYIAVTCRYHGDADIFTIPCMTWFVNAPMSQRQQLWRILHQGEHELQVYSNDACVYRDAQFAFSWQTLIDQSALSLWHDYVYQPQVLSQVTSHEMTLSEPVNGEWVTIYLGVDALTQADEQWLCADILRFNVAACEHRMHEKTDVLRIDHAATTYVLPHDKAIAAVDRLSGWDEQGRDLCFRQQYQLNFHDESDQHIHRFYSESDRLTGDTLLSFQYDQNDSVEPWVVSADVTSYYQDVQYPLQFESVECSALLGVLQPYQHFDAVTQDPWKCLQALTYFGREIGATTQLEEFKSSLMLLIPDKQKTVQLIVSSLASLSVQRISRRIEHHQGMVLSPGLCVKLCVDASYSDIDSLYMFLHVLTRMLNRLAPINSFVDVVCEYADAEELTCIA